MSAIENLFRKAAKDAVIEELTRQAEAKPVSGPPGYIRLPYELMQVEDFDLDAIVDAAVRAVGR